MGLEKFLKPVKLLDEEILRKYSKFAKKYEDKGKDIDSLTYNIGLVSLLSGSATLGLWHRESDVPIYQRLIIFPYALYCGVDMAHNTMIKLGLIKKHDIKDNTDSIDTVGYICQKFHQTTRLPVLITGIGLITKGIYDLYSYFTEGQAIDNTTFYHITLGASLFGQASSQYLKCRDPKLLDKAPAWKRAYDWMKEKIVSITPQPEPQLIPMKHYNTII